MSLPKPQPLAQWIATDSTNTEFVALRDIISAILRRKLTSASDEEIAEWSEQLVSPVGRELEQKVAESFSDGVTPSFEVSIDGGDAYFKVLSGPANTLLEKLKTMTPAGFEVFCSFILEGLHGTAVVESGSNDGGVDFYAYGLGPGGDAGPAPVPSRVFVIGQAKRYNDTNITETDLRQ